MSIRTRSDTSNWNALLFIALSCFWGTSFVAIEAGLEYFPPLLFAGIRYGIAGLAILSYAVATTDRWHPSGRDEWLSAAVAGVFIIAAYHALLYIGEMYVSASVAAVVVSLAPVLTAVFAAGILGQPLDKIAGVGFLLGIVGVVIVANPDPANLLSTNLLGIVLVLLSTASFAIGGVLTEPLRTSLPAESMQAWAMLIGAGVLFVGAVARGESPATIEWTSTAIISLMYLTFVSGVVGFLIYFALHERVGATEINLVSYLEPVVASLAGWVLLGHVVSSTTLVGFVTVFIGFALVKRHAIRARILGDVPTTATGHSYDAD
ncbi:dmt(drug/metabolite transporter) superfamily permease [Halogeometricum borinquense DSM 11551]|uniref:DMT(Drug/metabolite transporter) superfamily permease n=2 Tax=Halogeometricum borinquense TaxID=60847 RepID=E4NTP5_HALBP|nr:EamA family transporter [Halogeometricum borinquense]ADQ67097.1 DMT(drug/metabolite transporter) superfamily permease [Halogeometricum borinquense DSM 11551]ELY29643.1 dmt(drug/metabolite transporter) superfamily permease [Halogeometricum borinquense DSM 11551]RYJ13938.1 EamA/RhaT family transporter [Halogeometricum borinquense]